MVGFQLDCLTMNNCFVVRVFVRWNSLNWKLLEMKSNIITLMYRLLAVTNAIHIYDACNWCKLCAQAHNCTHHHDYHFVCVSVRLNIRGVNCPIWNNIGLMISKTGKKRRRSQIAWWITWHKDEWDTLPETKENKVMINKNGIQMIVSWFLKNYRQFDYCGTCG